MHSLAMRVYTLYNMKRGWLSYPYETELTVRDKLLTSITGGMDSESLYQASLTIQPLPPQPQRLLRRSSSENSVTKYEMPGPQAREALGTSGSSILMSASFQNEHDPVPPLNDG